MKHVTTHKQNYLYETNEKEVYIVKELSWTEIVIIITELLSCQQISYDKSIN